MKSLKQFVNENMLKPRNIDGRNAKQAQIAYQKVLKYIEDGCKGELDLNKPNKKSHSSRSVGGMNCFRKTNL